MYAHPDLDDTSTTVSRIHAVRLPPRLTTQVAALAARDANGLSATLRRLIAAGIRCEEQIHGGR